MSAFRKLPNSVFIGRQRYAIDPDFRIFVDLETDSRRGTVNADTLLKRFYVGNIPRNIEKAIEKLLWFHSCGDEDGIKQKSSQATQPTYDYEQDSDAIYQSFRLAYGIDLYTEDLHWWTFQNLLFGLPKYSPFMQRVYWRTADLGKLSKQERAFVIQQRKEYAIGSKSNNITIEQRNQSFVERLRSRAKEARCTK